MTRSLTFTVLGEARPQGSKNAFVNPKTGKPVVVESAGKPLKDWRSDVRATAIAQMNGSPPLEGPLKLTVLFLLPRGKSVKRAYPTVYPDLSKLIRGTEDALQSAGLFKDDAQIITINTDKRYTDGAPRATVTIEEIPEGSA